MSGSERGARVRAVRWGLIAAFLVALEVIPRLGLVNPIALVPLSEMVWQLWLLISDGILGYHILRTLTSIVAAGALAVVTGPAARRAAVAAASGRARSCSRT